MATITAYWSLFSITSTILLFLLCMTLKQFCNTNISDKQKCHRSMSVVLFSICAITLNTFTYLSSIYPHKLFVGLNLVRFTFIFEAIVTIIGFHIFCLFHKTIIDGFYKATNIQIPSWINYTFNILQIFVIIMIIICYSFVFIFNQWYTLMVFYILYAIILFSQSILVLVESKKILKLLNLQSPTISKSIQNVSNCNFCYFLFIKLSHFSFTKTFIVRC